MSNSNIMERDDDVSRLSSRVVATWDVLAAGTSQTALEILSARAEAARTAERDHLACAIETGMAAEALSRVTNHGDVERVIKEVTRINLRVLRRYRAVARYVLANPSALPMVLATRSIRAAADLVKSLTATEEGGSPASMVAAGADDPGEPPSLERAIGYLRVHAPALALGQAMAISAEADRSAQAARAKEMMLQIDWARCEEAIGIVMAAVPTMGSRAVVEMLTGAAIGVPAKLGHDGEARLLGTPTAEMGAVDVRFTATVNSAGDGRLAAVILNAAWGQVSAVRDIVAAVGDILTGTHAEILIAGTASAGRVAPDAVLRQPFVVVFGEGAKGGQGDVDAKAHLVRHGIVELRTDRRRLVIGMPSASVLSIMRDMGLSLSACDMHLSEPVKTVMAAMEGVEDVDVIAMLAALRAKDWQSANGAPAPF